MDSTTDEAPSKRMRIEGHEKTQIPQETMLEVLLWLDRFDLDGKQITARRMRSLVENKKIPLRKVHRVDYEGEERRYSDPYKRSRLSIRLKEDEVEGPAEVELQIETDADVRKAASYLSSCFVSDFTVYEHREVLPKNAIIAAPAQIRELYFRYCSFAKGDEDTLGETLNGSTFRRLALFFSSIPVWQIDDKRLESLRLRGCNDVDVFPDAIGPDDDTQNFKVTEEGILSYCFKLDDNLPMPESRTLRITWATITPAFFNKVVEASKNSRLTCDVGLRLEHLRFDVGNLDVGVPPSRSQPEYDRETDEHLHHVRYSIADHGNGMMLWIHFKSADGEEWEVLVRHGKKDHDEFFDPPADEEDAYSPSTEYLEHEPELEDPDEWYE